MATRRPYLLIVAPSLFLAACGGAAHKATTTTVGPGPLRAAARETLAQPAKAKLDATIDLGNITIKMNGTAAFAPGNKAAIHANVTLPLTPTQPFDEVYVNGVAWVKSPLFQNGNKWEHASQAPTLGASLFPFAHPTDLIALVGEGGKAQVSGTETVGGVKTTHYLTQVGKFPAEAWVDGQNRIREVKMNVKTTTGNQKVQAKLTMTLSDFGAPVTITSPVGA